MTDILSELTKQLGPLEKQSETAKIYLSKRDRLRELDVNLFLLEHAHTGELLKELRINLTVLPNSLQKIKGPMSGRKRNTTSWNRNWKN